jgi:DNA-binding NarL/FixJ family response regulator
MEEARRKILLVEDDRMTSAVIGEELVDRGFDIVFAYNGREGFAAILKHTPDLVICDINMPIMSGFEVLERLIALAPRFGSMPFLFLTAQTDLENELKGRKLGADDYITKPVDFDVLGMIVSARLARVARNELWPQQMELNDREVESLTWVSRGKTSSEIGQILGISKHTVDFHIDKAREKLGVATRIQAVIKAASGQLIKPWDEAE